MGKSAALAADDFVAIGRRYGSEDVAREAREARARWSRDVGELAPYGHGATLLAAFDAELAAHTVLRQERSDNVAAKTLAAASRDAATAGARVWVDKVVSILRPLARADAELATQLNEATPAHEAKLEAGVVALSRILERLVATLPADAEATLRIAEVAPVTAALASAPGTVATAKHAPIADTAELDLADGRLYVAIRDLNSAARKAIRNGALDAPSSEYAFKHLKRVAKKEPEVKDAPTT